MNYSLKSMLCLTLVSAIATVAIVQGSATFSRVLLGLGFAIFAVSVIGAFYRRGASRAWWGGQAIGMGLYGLAIKLGFGPAMPWFDLLMYLEGQFVNYDGIAATGIFIGGNFYHPVMLSTQVLICVLMGVFGGLVASYFHRVEHSASQE